MKEMLRDVWARDRKGFLSILLMNIAVSLMGGISIVLLVPMLGLLDVSDGAASALHIFTKPLHMLPYEAQVIVLIAGYLLLVVFKALLSRALSIRESLFLENYSYALRDQLYRTVSGAKWEQLAASRQTDTISLFTAQCSQVSYGVSEIIHLLTATVSAVVQLFIALCLSLPVTLFVLVFGGIFALVFRKLLKASKAYGDEMIRINRAMYAELFNQLKSVKEVRTYGVQKEHEALFDNISRTFRDTKLKYVHLRAFPSTLHSIASAAMIAVIFLVCVLAFQMDTARLMVLVYVFMRLWPVFSGFIGRVNSILTSAPAYTKLRNALDTLTPEKADVAAAPLPFSREIEFRNVAFSYENSDEKVLRNVCFRLRKGAVTALVGRSGAGKTTIADLLLGFLSPTSGEILIDGIPLTQQTLPAWRQRLGYIPQEPLILNASVRENLLRFHPGASEAEMTDALKKAQAWPIVEALPQGLDTLLGDDGVRLSGGERQRIVLARVLLGNPRLIIMDEATSAMDYESETAVRAAIAGLSEETTILIIAHRLATVRTAKYALVLENGQITEEGELQQLLKTPNGYLNKLLYIE